MFRRELCKTLENRLKEPRRFIQVLAGPRQVGKTTAVRQVLEGLNMPSHYASADDPSVQSVSGIEQQWDIGRLLTKTEGRVTDAVLVLDEIQKIPGWADLVKLNWDRDSAAGLPLKVVILG
jgi:predicted AAA+ superfamily ATPase